MFEETISHFELGSYAKTYDEINGRFERLENAIIRVIDENRLGTTKFASKKDLSGFELQLKDLADNMNKLSKKVSETPSSFSSSIDSEFQAMFAKWVSASKSEFGDLIEKYPSLSEKLDTLQEEIKTLSKKTKEQEDMLSRVSEELKGFSLLEQRLSLLVLKEVRRLKDPRNLNFQ